MLKTLKIQIKEGIDSSWFRFCLLLQKRSRIISPLQLDGVKNFIIGKNVTVSKYSWLAAMPLTGETPELVIEDRTCIGHFAHIYATKSIHIGKKVLIADKVYISDNLHGYENVKIPVIDQTIVQKKNCCDR